MSRSSDDDDVRADELLVAGRAAPGDEALAEVLGAMRAMADAPEPHPSAALLALLGDGLPRAAAGTAPERPAVPLWRRAVRWVAGLGIAGKVVLGAGVAVAGTTGVATIPAVPDAVQEPVRGALDQLGHLLTGDPAPAPAEPAVTTTPAATPSGRPGSGGATEGGAKTAGAASSPAGSPASSGGAASQEPDAPGASRAPEDGDSEGGAVTHPPAGRPTSVPVGPPPGVPAGDRPATGRQPGPEASATPAAPGAAATPAGGGEAGGEAGAGQRGSGDSQGGDHGNGDHGNGDSQQ